MSTISEQAELPIDIHYNKLLDWLIDRKKVPREWHKNVREARIKLEIALSALSSIQGEAATQITQLLKSRYIDYYTCTKVIEILKENSLADTDLLGRYKSDISKTWYAVIDAYEKEDVFLADSAQVLMKLTDSEIPLTKKNISRCQTSIADFTKKEVNCTRAAKESKEKFEIACAEYSLDSELCAAYDLEQFEKAIAGAVSEKAPVLLRNTITLSCAQEMTEILDFYQAFAEYSSGADVNTIMGLNICQTLKTIRKRGTDAACRGDQEKATDNDKIAINWDDPVPGAFAGDNQDKIEINWDAPVDARATTNDDDKIEINWDAPTEKSAAEDNQNKVEIYWDVPVDATISGADVKDKIEINWNAAPIQLMASTNDQQKIEINWDAPIETTVSADNKIENSWDLNGDDAKHANTFNEKSKYEGDIASSDIYLEDDFVRNKFLDDLYELQAFLRQRVSELEIHSSMSLMILQSEQCPKQVKTVDETMISKMLSHIEKLIDSLTTSNARTILALRQSRGYVKRVARALTEKKNVSKKMEIMKESLVRRRLQASEDLEREGPALNSLVTHLRELQCNVEQTIASQYNGRKVNIIGAINAL